MTVRMKQSWDINSQVKSTVFEEKYSPLPLASQIVHWRPWDRIRVSSQKTEINPLAWHQLIWVMYFFRPLLAGGEHGQEAIRITPHSSAANLGNSGWACVRQARALRKCHRQRRQLLLSPSLSLSLSLSLSVALSLLSTTVESHILVFNCCATTKYLWHHACKGEKLSLYRPLGVEEV